MKSRIKNNSTLKSALKILHVVKQLKEDDAAQKEKTKGKSKEKKKVLG